MREEGSGLSGGSGRDRRGRDGEAGPGRRCRLGPVLGRDSGGSDVDLVLEYTAPPGTKATDVRVAKVESAWNFASCPACCAWLDLIIASRSASAWAICASRFTCAIRGLPKASKYPWLSRISRIVKLTMPNPMFAMSPAATSCTFDANASRFW